MKREQQVQRAAIAFTAACATALAFGASAAADGVVVESTSSRYDASDRIANGAEVAVERGAFVVVMDPAGNAHRFSGGSSVYRDAANRSGGRGGISQRVFGAAGQVVVGAGESERIGATRGGNFCDDEELPVGRSVACGQENADARLEAWLLDEDGVLEAGSALRFMVEASVDLRVMCQVGGDDGDWRPAGNDLSGGPVMVRSGVRVLVPRRGAVDAAMLMPGDAATLRCYGVEPQTWDLLRPTLASDAGPDEVFAVTAVYAETRQSVFLQTLIDFKTEAAAED